MTFNLSRLYGLVFLALSSVPSLANATALYQEPMLRLDGKGQLAVETLTKYQGKPLVTSFFMPRCNWCHRQLAVFQQLGNECPELNTVLLGVQGSKRELKQELKRKKSPFPAYLASMNIVNAIGEETPMPFVLMFNPAGELVYKISGFTKQLTLKSILDAHLPSACS